MRARERLFKSGLGYFADEDKIIGNQFAFEKTDVKAVAVNNANVVVMAEAAVCVEADRPAGVSREFN